MDDDASKGPFIVVRVADCRGKEPFKIFVFFVFFRGPSANGLVELPPDTMVYSYAGPLEGWAMALNMTKGFLECFALWVESFAEAAFIVVFYAPLWPP